MTYYHAILVCVTVCAVLLSPSCINSYWSFSDILEFKPFWPFGSNLMQTHIM